MKKFLATAIIIAAVTVNAPRVLAKFADLSPTHKNFAAINFLSNLDIFQGYGDGTVKPDGQLNRAEFVTLLFRALDQPISALPDSAFSDVNSDDWFAPAVSQARRRGWVQGYSDGKFRPERTINKAEALKIIGEAYNWQPTTGSTDPFIDVQSMTWFGPYVAHAKSNNYLAENSAYFSPEKQITRGEVGEVIYRIIADEQGIEVEQNTNTSVFNDVAFAAQAPFGEWHDIRQSEACEEAAVYMAVKHFRNEPFTLEQAKQEMIAIYNHQIANYWTAHDTSTLDTFDWIVKDYFNYDNSEIHNDISASDILAELHKGNLVVLHVNGRELKNPYFTAPGPLQHAILVHGYDAEKAEFVTHEPGTRWGGNHRYSWETIERSIYDYESGELNYLPERQKRMIVIGP